MAFNNLDQNDEDIADINIVPLVDVMLVLLIIFMVTAPLSISGIKVNLPNSKARGTSVNEKKIVLTIDKKGRYFFDKSEVKANALGLKLKGIYEFRKEKILYIRADKKVIYDKVVTAMSHAKVAGVNKMSMLTVR